MQALQTRAAARPSTANQRSAPRRATACSRCESTQSAESRQIADPRRDHTSEQPAGPSRRHALLGAAAVSLALANASSRPAPAAADYMKAPEGSAGPAFGEDLPQMDAVKRIGKVAHSEEEWARLLTPAQYSVLRQANTERSFSSALYTEKRQGVYRCGGCGAALFDASTKYNSGTGWPSFFQALPGAVTETNDYSIMFMPRTEVRCSACQGHLGHVFRDGPPPTDLRYCMNGLALQFEPAPGSA